MGHQDDRLSPVLPDALDLGIKILAGDVIKPGERLVHQAHARRAGGAKPLAHPLNRQLRGRSRIWTRIGHQGFSINLDRSGIPRRKPTDWALVTSFAMAAADVSWVRTIRFHARMIRSAGTFTR